MTVTGDTGYSTNTAARLAGVTARQVDYWDRTGLLTPAVPASGSGTRKRYSSGDVHKLRLVRALLDAGLDHAAIRRTLAIVLAAGQDGLRWLVLDPGGPHAVSSGGLERQLADDRVAVATVVDLRMLEGQDA